MPSLKDIVFLILSLFTLVSAAGVTFSRRIVYSGFSLLGTFAGIAGLFVLLSSDFVAVTQVMIYVGGILILVLFAIMLTNRVGDLNLVNQSINYKVAVPIVGGLAFFLISVLSEGVWKVQDNEVYQSMVKPIGDALLKDYLLPFEVISFVLLGAMVGALVIIRREVK